MNHYIISKIDVSDIDLQKCSDVLRNVEYPTEQEVLGEIVQIISWRAAAEKRLKAIDIMFRECDHDTVRKCLEYSIEVFSEQLKLLTKVLAEVISV